MTKILFFGLDMVYWVALQKTRYGLLVAINDSGYGAFYEHNYSIGFFISHIFY